MPRANRYFQSGNVWHITHRCHKKEFLLKFSKDRVRWLHWLYEAKKRFGLSVLNYVVTSNHIHLLVKDTGNSVISNSLQLIAGRTAPEYDHRKNRKGSYWVDRYHATAIDTGEHLLRCLVYIDLNIVRAGVAQHPSDWLHGGYHDIQSPRDRHRILNLTDLITLSGAKDLSDLQTTQLCLIEEMMNKSPNKRNVAWSSSIAVGNERFVNTINDSLGMKTKYRTVIKDGEDYLLRDEPSSYTAVFDTKKNALSQENEAELDA